MSESSKNISMNRKTLFRERNSHKIEGPGRTSIM